jgi:hypothetical protein
MGLELTILDTDGAASRRSAHRPMPRRKLFIRRRNINLLLSEPMAGRIDAALAEGETRTGFLRTAAEKELRRREKGKKKKAKD